LPSPTDEPLLDADDIQGNILPGFRRNVQLFVGFTLGAGADARAALAALADAVTPLATVLAHKAERKLALAAGRRMAPRADLWVNLALSTRAANALGLTTVQDLDLALAAGMRPARTGDAVGKTLSDGTPNPAHPGQWAVGGPTKPLDLLVIFAADSDIEAAARPLIDAVSTSGAVKIYEERGALLPGDIEHFGFQDGISQPGVHGVVEVRGRDDGDGAIRPITTRYGVPSRNGLDYGKPGQPLAWPTQFLVGLRGPDGLLDDVEPALRNGSLMVFRRLRQDVAAFHAETAAMARQLPDAPSAELLRARIVGRWPSGQPLMRPTQGSPTEPESPLAINHFEYQTDVPELRLTGSATEDGTRRTIPGADVGAEPLRGVRCPIWAHVRKVNPRDLGTNLGGPFETLGFQMLRRGIPFGPVYDHTAPEAPVNHEERGLLFVSYQRSITDQFEKLNSNWMNSAIGPVAGGTDLLVGQRLDPATGLHGPKDAELVAAAGAPAIRISAPAQWVVPTGGAYLFAPSISTITALSRT